MAGQNKNQKLQIKDRKGKKAAVPEGWGAAAGFATRVTQKKVALYKTVVETDYGYIFIAEKHFPYRPGGAAAVRAMNNTLAEGVKMFKEHAARRLREYDATGCLA